MPKLNLLLLAICLLVLHVESGDALAQDNQPSVELGVQFSGLYQNNSTFFSSAPRVSILGGDPDLSRWAPGLGARAGYNINRFWALEAEMNFFPSSNSINGQIVELLAGTKVGLRTRKAGLYGKVRPGFLHMSKSASTCIIVFGVGSFCEFDKRRRDFALDVGGVLELYSSKNWFVRFDLGDTVQFFRGNDVDFESVTPFPPIKKRAIKTAQNSEDTFDVRPHTYHNFQFSGGVSFRF